MLLHILKSSLGQMPCLEISEFSAAVDSDVLTGKRDLLWNRVDRILMVYQIWKDARVYNEQNELVKPGLSYVYLEWY